MASKASPTDLFSGVLPFFHVADAQSFRAAAERLGVTTAATSKAVAKLEQDLGVVLLNRTSRRVALTPEGALFFERCREAIGHLQAGREILAESQKVPQGVVHVSTTPILADIVIEALPRLASRHPRLSYRISVSDRLARLVEEDVDVAVRIGALQDSSLVARPLRTSRFVTVASPAYLGRHGPPRTPEDLGSQNCLRYVGTRGAPRAWTFRIDGKLVDVPTRGNFLVDQGDLLMRAALAGLGVAQILDFMSAPHVREGRLVEVLAPFAPPGPPIHAVCLPRRRSVPKVRALLDFLLELFAGRELT